MILNSNKRSAPICNGHVWHAVAEEKSLGAIFVAAFKHSFNPWPATPVWTAHVAANNAVKPRVKHRSRDYSLLWSHRRYNQSPLRHNYSNEFSRVALPSHANQRR
jgi:hypothetical protein